MRQFQQHVPMAIGHRKQLVPLESQDHFRLDANLGPRQNLQPYALPIETLLEFQGQIANPAPDTCA